MIHTPTSRGRRAQTVAATVAGVVVLVLVLGACGFSVGSSNPTIDASKVEQKIRKFLPGSSKLKVTKVDCPEGIREKRGRNFSCSAVLGGDNFTIRVTQKDSGGNIHLERVEAIIDPAKAEQLLESNSYTGVDCGSDLVVVAPGKTFSCGATDATGRSGTVTLTATSRSGTVTIGSFVGGGA